MLSTDKKKRESSRKFKRPKHSFISEKDIILQVAPINKYKVNNYIISQPTSKCIGCDEIKKNVDFNYINCKLKGYQERSYRKNSQSIKPICVTCIESYKIKPCPNCEGSCCSRKIEYKRFNKKKKSFAERKNIIECENNRNERKKRRNRSWINRELYMLLLSKGLTSQEAKKAIISQGSICSWWYYK